MSLQHFRQSLKDRRGQRGSSITRFGATLKYLARSARAARLHLAWLDFIYGTTALHAMLRLDPRLIDRPQHHYINRRLTLAHRYAVIHDHYAMLLSAFPPAMVDAICLDGRCPLGSVRLKNGSVLVIEFRRPTGRSREGELCLCLTDASQQLLSSMTFSVADGGRSLLIGCVQGAPSSLGREAVRELTKFCHGLRPKNLLLSLLRAFALHFDIRQIRGVANATHPFAGQSDKIKADYDSFWLECDGVLDPDGFYELPLEEPVRDELLVISKHRSAFRQREALRREACTSLLESFNPTSTYALAG